MKKNIFLTGFISWIIFSCTSPMEHKFTSDKKVIHTVVKELDSVKATLLLNSIDRLKSEGINLKDMTFGEIIINGEKWQNERKSDIGIVRYFIDNQYKKVTSENGIIQNYQIEIKTVSKNKKFESQPIVLEHGDFKKIVAYQAIFHYKLFINTEQKDEVDFKGYIVESLYYDVNHKPMSDFRDTKLYYIPELDQPRKKEIIKSWINLNNCGHEKKANKIWIQNAVKALHESGLVLRE